MNNLANLPTSPIKCNLRPVPNLRQSGAYFVLAWPAVSFDRFDKKMIITEVQMELRLGKTFTKIKFKGACLSPTVLMPI